MKRLISIVGWVLTVFLCLIYGIPFALLAVPPMRPFEGQVIPVTVMSAWLMFYVFLLIPVVLVFWLCKNRHWDAKGYYRGGFLLLLLALTPLFLVDAPPVQNDHTWDSIPSPHKDAGNSHRLLMSLQSIELGQDEEVMPFLGTFPESSNLLAHASAIESMWSGIEPARKIIEELSGFDEIENTVTDPNNDVRPLVRVRNLAQRYWVYASLEVAQGKPEEGVLPLIQLHSVCRKSLPFSKSLFDKMLWVALCGGGIHVARDIANSPNCNNKALQLLQEGFEPLTDGEISLQGAFTGGYLLEKDYVRLLPNAQFLDSFPQHIVYGPRQPPPCWSHSLSRVVAFVAFRRNRTIHDVREYFDILIEGTAKHPMDISATEVFAKTYAKKPDFRNMGGWLLVLDEASSGFKKVVQTTTKTKVLSDLLFIELHERLGEQIEIPDYFTGKNYIQDKGTGTLSSAGPDGIPGTKDDIVLGKW